MDFRFDEDIELACSLMNFSHAELAESIGVSRMTIHRWLRNPSQASPQNIESFYNFAFKQGIRLNQIKAQLYREECAAKGLTLLFHEAKTSIEGRLSVSKSKASNDFGRGFYCGETLEQSSMFICKHPASSLYAIAFNPYSLKCINFSVDRDWMIAIASHRGSLTEFHEAQYVQRLLSSVSETDYLIAPIADNRMFEIIDSFAAGEMTDVQCQHCLSATHLGNQFVMKSEKALSQTLVLEHCYLCQAEKDHYAQLSEQESKTGFDKAKVARRKYRGQGRYIDELFDAETGELL